MDITIHRGQNQIGGSIIEISSATTRIIFDAGAEFEETEPVAPEVDGLFCGIPSVDAVFISHYHGDHIGLCGKVLPGIPLYIGKAAQRVTNVARTYLRKPSYAFAGNYESGAPMQIGNMTVTPYLCDHSAFDSYMFHVSCGGKALWQNSIAGSVSCGGILRGGRQHTEPESVFGHSGIHDLRRRRAARGA